MTTTRVEMDTRIASRYADDFLRSAGVVIYADRRRAHRIHVLTVVTVSTVFVILAAVSLGPIFASSVHQVASLVYQVSALRNWSSQS